MEEFDFIPKSWQIAAWIFGGCYSGRPKSGNIIGLYVNSDQEREKGDKQRGFAEM